MFIYTHTEIVPGFIAISAMLSSQYIIISGLIRDLHITAEHQLRWHADMLNVQVAVSSGLVSSGMFFYIDMVFACEMMLHLLSMCCHCDLCCLHAYVAGSPVFAISFLYLGK